MKKTLLITGALLALCAGLASAGPGGINLAWTDCGLSGTENRTFACNTNSGTHVLMGTFKASSYMVSVTGFSAVVDAQGAGVSYPAWWTIRVGGCRATASLIYGFDFTGGPLSCYDYWQGGAVGGGTMNAAVGNRSRILTQAALPAGDSRITAIPEGTEVYCFKFTVNSAKTAGLGACAGCLDRMCFCLNQIFVTQTPGNPAGNKIITVPADNNIARWQGTGNVAECQGATPARNTTWGQVKSLYR